MEIESRNCHVCVTFYSDETLSPGLWYVRIVVMQDWLRPPRNLLVILVLLTVVSVSAIGWLGWRLVAQERIVSAESARERLERTADRIAANFRRNLNTPNGIRGLRLNFDRDSFEVAPPDRLLFYARPQVEPEASDGVFREGEIYEFRMRQPSLALAFYERLAHANDAAVRAGALLRLARVLRNIGRRQEAIAAYERLSAIVGVRVANAPAELIARYAIYSLRPVAQNVEQLLADLHASRWHLTRSQFEFYWDEVSKLDRSHAPPDAARMALAEAASSLRSLNASPHGAQQIIQAGGIPILAVWRDSAGRRAVLLATVDSVLQQICKGEPVYCVALDSDGKRLSGQEDKIAHLSLRRAAEFDIPWTLGIAARAGQPDAEALARQRFLRTAIGVMMLFLLSGTYFIWRAIRREAEISRLQSDFVSGVSHEFRTPLTSMRQLSELLIAGRVPSEERRLLYYETLLRETNRLSRLVEALLNFGRLDAAAHQYNFQEIEAGQVVLSAVAAFEGDLGQPRKIERAGERGCWIRADAEALGVAIRNLLDNAFKYSSADAGVQIEWMRNGKRIAIQVLDHGPGIPPRERRRIFEKFVRGSAAVALNVSGTGIGLAMVHRIVDAHKGALRLESELGRGSKFTIILPASEPR
jgi:signal transduction histidine kinase